MEIDETDRLVEAPIPAVKDIQQRMFERIRKAGVEAIADLSETASLEDAARDADALASSRLARRAAMERLDANGDQRISVAEIEALGHGEESPLTDFIAFVFEEMGFGVGGENVSRLSVEYVYSLLLTP